MRTCSLEVIILDLDTSEYGSSPCLAVLCDFCCCFSVCFFVVVIFGVKKTCLSIIHAILSAFLHVCRLPRICKYTYMK